MPRWGKQHDLTGKRFGDWTVIHRAKTVKGGCVYWLCQCSCLAVHEVAGASLRQGKSPRCRRCAAHKPPPKPPKPRKPRFKDEAGKVYGKLTVVRRGKPRGDTYCYWVCRCECETVIETRGHSLRNGHTRSCGRCSVRARPNQDNYYCDPGKLASLLNRAKAEGRVSDELGALLLAVVTGALRRFAGGKATEDMAQTALVWVLSSLHKLDPRKCDPFAYIVRAAQWAALGGLRERPHISLFEEDT